MPTLQHISFELSDGSLTCVVGRVGAGKSSLLSALLGEIPTLDGTVSVRGTVAYCSQQPWVQNMSIRQNITAGLPHHPHRYSRAIRCAQLLPDLEALEDGDSTEVGERGVTLSGGQKARVALARAVYADADVYLLDDVLSAVDPHVARLLFEECIVGILKTKTVMLCTHQLQWIPYADRVIVLSDGSVQHDGAPDELRGLGIDLSSAVADERTNRDISSNTLRAGMLRSDCSGVSGASAGSGTPRSPASPMAPAIAPSPASPMGSDKTVAGRRLVEEEHRHHGAVAWRVWRSYIGEIGGITAAATVVVYVACEASELAGTWWLQHWSKSKAPTASASLFLGIYAGLAGGSMLQTST